MGWITTHRTLRTEFWKWNIIFKIKHLKNKHFGVYETKHGLSLPYFIKLYLEAVTNSESVRADALKKKPLTAKKEKNAFTNDEFISTFSFIQLEAEESLSSSNFPTRFLILVLIISVNCSLLATYIWFCL